MPRVLYKFKRHLDVVGNIDMISRRKYLSNSNNDILYL